eukprot:13844957-Alexandrium_andersonii.AAC.1
MAVIWSTSFWSWAFGVTGPQVPDWAEEMLAEEMTQVESEPPARVNVRAHSLSRERPLNEHVIHHELRSAQFDLVPLDQNHPTPRETTLPCRVMGANHTS